MLHRTSADQHFKCLFLHYKASKDETNKMNTKLTKLRHFLGLGGFHMETILLCVIGQFLFHIDCSRCICSEQNILIFCYRQPNYDRLLDYYKKLLFIFGLQNKNKNSNTTKFIYYPVQ